MSKPTVADNKPAVVELEKDKKYFFCSCGLSQSQPFCDGSHKGSDFTPQVFTAEKDGKGFLCTCKHSANLPYCDGSHKQFDADAVGIEGPGSNT